MKKSFLTLTSVLTILFAQAQCQAYFGYIQNGPTTIFTDSSTMQSTNYSATWFWDFGDGNTSAQQNPIHTYSNGIYSACLTVIFFDSTIMNYCTSIYCDSLLVGNGLPVSWDCGLIGCYDPGTGIGQYTTLSSCQSICGNVTDSFACMGGVAPGITTCVGPGIYTMGQTYVMAVYSTMAACIADSCNVMPPLASWDCSPNLLGCYDPGTGLGQYTTLSSCQSNCSSTTSNYCDSMTASGSQFQITMGINNINTIIDYWVTTAPNGAILQEDSIANTHTVYQNTQGMPYDTIITCITYPDPVGYYTCCVTWVWNGSFWAKMGSVTSVGEINYTDKKLIKIVDVLGRETFPKSNENLFYIYDDGTVEKRIVIE